MSLLNFLKDIFGGPENAFQKLTPDYFLQQRNCLRTEEYAVWIKKQWTYYNSMAHLQKEKGLPIPPHWISELRMIEEKIEKIKKQDASHLFSSNMRKTSGDFK